MTGNRPPTVHIVGAGLAGLSAAVQLAGRGRAVVLYEAAPQAGGRCRSYEDPVLGCRIDNGNHLLLSGNSSTLGYLALIGAPDALWTAPEAAFPFLDLASDERWAVRLSKGRVPWWLFSKNRRVAGTVPLDYLAAGRLAFAGADATVAAVLTQGLLFERFWEPLTVAALNTTPDRASARLLWQAMKESFAKGAHYCRPMIARDGLSEAFVEPALRYLDQHGGAVRLGQRLRQLETAEGRATALVFGGEAVPVEPGEQVILAVPPSQLKRLMPALDLPDDQSVILNVHFRLPDRFTRKAEPQFLGLLGGQAHWLFVRGDIASITISAADWLGLADADEEALLPVLWREVCQALGLPGADYRAARLIRERRATFDQSPEGVARRPGADIGLPNLVLAGDFTRTGLPATIEGAIRSGETAARLVAGR